MDLISGLIRDVVWEVFNRLDGGSCHAISVVSKSWYAFVAESIPEYVSFYQCIVRAGTGHYLHVLRHMKLDGRKELYKKSNRLKYGMVTDIINKSVCSGNIRMINMLLTYLEVDIFRDEWLLSIILAHAGSHDEIVKLLLKKLNSIYSGDLFNRMLLSGVCRRGNIEMFRTIMLMNMRISHIDKIGYSIGVGGNIEIFNEFETHPKFNIESVFGGICSSGNTELLKYILINKSYDITRINGSYIGFGGNINMFALLPHINPESALTSACQNHHIHMVKYILTKSNNLLVNVKNVIDMASFHEYEELLTFVLDFAINKDIIHDIQTYLKTCLSVRQSTNHLTAIVILKKYIS